MIKPNSSYFPPRAASKKCELSRLLTAAVVSAHFRASLLADPLGAANAGYEGEQFRLDPIEKERIRVINAGTLRDFAAQISAI